MSLIAYIKLADGVWVYGVFPSGLHVEDVISEQEFISRWGHKP